MNKVKASLTVGVYSLFWFLLSPFPFENGGWSLFGGYKLLQPWLTIDWMAKESATSEAYYESSLYPVILICSSLILGFISWRIMKLLIAKKSSNTG